MNELIKKLKALAFILPLFLLSIPAHAHYAIYIDAGSSKSSLYLYHYETTTPLATINAIFSEKATPGLSSFLNNPIGAAHSIKLLLNKAKQQLKENHVDLKNVSVNILSTAGMRLLTKAQQNEIYKTIKYFIKKNYEFSLGKIETISGEDEGLYGWLTVNYLMQTFQKELPSLGSLDMGNASTQITFATNDKSPDHSIQLKIAGKDYSLVSRSFLGLGLRESRNAEEIKNFIGSCYPFGYQITTTQLGAFNFEKCTHVYTQLITRYNVANAAVYPRKMQFVAYGAFYTPLHFFKLDTSSEKNINNTIKNICSKPWEVIEKTFSKTEKVDYLPHYCAEATYINDLLFKGYHLSNNQLLITKEINGQKIAWPLGALLYSLI